MLGLDLSLEALAVLSSPVAPEEPGETNIIQNGGYDDGAYWALGGSGVSISGGKLNFAHAALGGARTATNTPLVSVEADRYYDTSLTISGRTVGGARITIGGTQGTLRTADGTYTERLLTTSSAAPVVSSSGSTTLAVDDVSAAMVPPVTLNELTLSSSTVPEDATPATVVGALQGTTLGSTVIMVDGAGGQFEMGGAEGTEIVVAGNTLTVGPQHVTVSESISGATNSPRQTLFTITVTEASD